MADEKAVATAAGEVTMNANEAKAKADEAVKLHKDRCKTILASDEAKGRSELANFLAFETDITAEAAIQALAKSPKPVEAKAPEPIVKQSHFEAVMASTRNPDVGPDGGVAKSEAEEAAAMAKAAIELYRGASKGIA